MTDVNNSPEFEFPEIDFGDAAEAQPVLGQESAGATQAQPQPEPQVPSVAPQPVPAPAPQQVPVPTPPVPTPQAFFGPATARVQQELEAAKARYAALLQQRKALEESGYGVPPELNEELNRLLVRQEALAISLNEAKRADAAARIPALVQQSLAVLPPNWAKAVRPYFEQVLQNAIAANPDLVNDPVTVNHLLNLAIGAAQRDALTRRAPQPQPAQGSYSTPPAPKPDSVAIPEEVRRYGVSEDAWRRVSAQKPNEKGYYDLEW
jgi:hypothetical protein